MIKRIDVDRQIECFEIMAKITKKHLTKYYK